MQHTSSTLPTHARKSSRFLYGIGSGEMEGSSSRTPEITIVPAPRPAAGGGGGAVDAVKAASKEPISPGSPSPASKERHGAVSLPGWKLDSLCKESSSPPAMMARFPYF